MPGDEIAADEAIVINEQQDLAAGDGDAAVAGHGATPADGRRTKTRPGRIKARTIGSHGSTEPSSITTTS